MLAERGGADDGEHPDPLEFIPSLEDGVLLRGPDGEGAVRAGEQFIKPRVRPPAGELQLLDDAIGGGFRLLGLERDPRSGLGAEQVAWWDAFGTTAVILGPEVPLCPVDGVVTIADDDGFLRSWMLETRAETVLVRPDNYVFGVASGIGSTNRLVADLRWQLRSPGGSPEPVGGAATSGYGSGRGIQARAGYATSGAGRDAAA